MIAYLPPAQKTCDACRGGPCNDGTCCSGAFKERGDWNSWPVGSIEIGPAMAYRDFSIKWSREVRHPRHQDQPRSPRPGFRKR